MTGRRINQVLVGAAGGDAITAMARTIRGALRERGQSDIYAHFIAPDVAGDVVPLDRLGPGQRNDIIVYHASYGTPEVTRALLNRPERVVLIYHNITPSSFFLEHQPEFAVGLEWGRYELSLLRDRVVLSIADSSFNASALAAEGFDDVQVMPAGLRPSRLRSVAPDARLAREISERFPSGFVLGVSQLLPHKRFETMVGAMHLVQWVHELELGLVVVGTPRLPKYLDALHRQARLLRVERTWFTGSVTESALATFFRMTRMLVSTSAHEGLALPPLEAMSFGTPVVARAAGAIAETIGNGGIVLPASSGPMLLSETIAEVHRNDALRLELVGRGLDRVAAIESQDPSGKFIELLDLVA
ncbi:MAG: glycosyltransferase family 4 protein [Acidimicrobiales bacterium]